MNPHDNDNRPLVHGRSIEWWCWQGVTLIALFLATAVLIGAKPQ